LYYRKPDKKNSPEEASQERGRFRGHWIIMLWWLFGTIIIPALNLNILLMVPWIIIGAFSATFLSGSPKSQNRDLEPPALVKPQIELSRESLDSNTSKIRAEAGKAREITKQDVKPNQSARLPDLGKRLALKGTPQKQMMIYPSFTITEIAVVGLGSYCANKVQELNGDPYFGTFDFGDHILDRIMGRATERTKNLVIGSLTEDPASVVRR
jgi:hypothetical protein